ncbi:MAG: UDP-2,4-diacetamido-2,4,6-trideoxy-beta-L-altropyranose hydrolase [Proteobacteria bacterium]|nr:MAG: UDP-2,4-diacetamido-2,4,6-trideoxy-beta-L-altropyranose hydrolase [Pseudomonadota bacterium]
MIAVFRVDASVESGMGHLIRCTALAKELVHRNVKIFFYSRILSDGAKKNLDTNGFEYFLSRPFGLEPSGSVNFQDKDADLFIDWAKETFKAAKIDFLIVDNYTLDSVWETRVKELARILLVIDDLANRAHVGTILLDAAPPNQQDPYAHLIPRDMKRMYGPSFALLRNEFISPSIQNVRHHISRILICFGGTDPTRTTTAAFQAISQWIRVSEVEVFIVLGDLSSQPEVLNLAKDKTNVSLYENCTAAMMAKLCREADLSIGAGGTMAWERCAQGLPTIVTAIAENQIGIAKQLHYLKCIEFLGYHTEVHDFMIIEALNHFFENPNNLSEMSRRCFEMTTGNGAALVSDTLFNQAI